MRADAQRSIGAILDAAVDVLRERPDASMADIATAAGVTRQTVYAHFPSREGLLAAVMDRALNEAVAAIDAMEPDEGPADEALARVVGASWQTLERHARLLDSLHATVSPEQLHELHRPILDRLDRLIRRGQRDGVFDRRQSRAWLLAAVLGLMHAAGQEVGAERMSADEAAESLGRTVPRVFGVGA